MKSSVGQNALATAVAAALVLCGCGSHGSSSEPGDAAAPSTCTPGDVPQLIMQFQSSDPATADQAYQSLFCSGTGAIDALLALGDSTAIYPGGAFVNPNSSILPESSPSVALTAIFLVEGIRLGSPAPHVSARLRSTPLLDDGDALQIAVQRYRAWWTANQGKSLADLATIDPLAGASPTLFWDGGTLTTAAAASPPALTSRYNCPITPFGSAVPNSDTPEFRFLGFEFSFCEFTAPYGCRYKPATPPGRTPYNCLAWALGFTDRWMEEAKADGKINVNVHQIIRAYGYQQQLAACSDACPAGTGPKIGLVFENGSWLHAVQQEPDGTWTSKNGECFLYNDIQDSQRDDFVKAYFAELGVGPNIQTECWCKASPTDPPPPPLGGGTSVGDPHLTTFDALHYNLQAVGELTLTLDTTDNAEIQVRTQPWPGSHTVAMNVAVAARVGSDIVALYADGTLRINHAVTTLADGSSTALTSGKLYHTGIRYVAVWPDNTQLWIQPLGPSLTVKVFPSTQRQGKLTGLLGNFDGNLTNEFATRQGVALPRPMPAAALYNSYAESWRITQASSLFDYDTGQTTDTFTDRTFPHVLTSTQNLSDAARAAATATCQAANVAPEWLDDCILDVAETGNASFADAFGDLPTPVAPAKIDETGGVVTPGTCTPTGSMLTPRLGFESRAVTLASGQVLVAGGLDTGAGHVLADAELYDPLTGTFSAAGAMTTPRMRFALIPLASGKILAAGGVNDTGAIDATAELYDPAQNTWTPTGSMVAARTDVSGAAIPSGRGLVVGGAHQISGFNRTTGVITLAAALSTFEIYDSASGLFASKTNPVAGTSLFGVTPRLDGTVFAVTATTGEYYTSDTAPIPGSFTSIGALPTAIDGGGAFAFTLPSGDVFALPALGLADSISGSTVGGPVLISPTNKLTQLANHTIGGTSAAIRLVTGDVFIVGGQKTGAATAATQVWRAASKSWDAPQATDVVRHGPVLANLPDGGVLVMGGCTTNSCGATVLSSAEICNPAPSP